MPEKTKSAVKNAAHPRRYVPWPWVPQKGLTREHLAWDFKRSMPWSPPTQGITEDLCPSFFL